MLTLKKTSECTISDKEQRQRFTSEFTERKAGHGDLTIKVHNGTTLVHRKVLMSTSDYFKSMFTAGFSETNASAIDLSDMFEDIQQLDTVIEYMYTGTIQLSGDNIESVLNSACHFLQTDLQKVCSTFLKVNMSPSTCIGILVLAERYSLSEVQAICVEVIKAWFHVNLCKSPEALDLPPHCLRVLIKENVLQMMPDQLRKSFLREWHDKFATESSGKMDLPKELDDILKTELPQNTDAGKNEVGTSKESHSDVLYSVFTVPNPDSLRCCVEVHAFLPEEKNWKFVLHHTFGESVSFEAVPYIVGVTCTNAYFMFLKEDLKDAEECVISVDLKTATETLLPPPTGISSSRGSYGGWPYYFLWGQTLHALCGCYMYKEISDGQWEKLLYVPSEYGSVEYLAVPCGDCLYLWIKEYAICGSSLGYLRCYFSKVTVSSETGVYEISEVTSPITDEDQSDWPSTLANISADATHGTLSFTHVMDQNEDIVEGTEDDWQKELNCDVLTYDIQEDSWSFVGFCQIPFPFTHKNIDSSSEDESEEDSAEDSAEDSDIDSDKDGKKQACGKPLSKTGSLTAQPMAAKYNTKFPIVSPCKRLAVDTRDNKYSIKKGLMAHYPETCVGALYYLKTTSPYNTTLWSLDVDEAQWHIIAHLPHPLDRYPHFQPVMAPSDWLMTLPDSIFKDISTDMGESALARLEWSAADINMDFGEELLTTELYEQEWRKAWHGALK